MKGIVFVVVWILSSNLPVVAQDENLVDSSAVVTNSLWDNWYGQLGFDMTLMNPYGTNFTEVFPKGLTEKSVGIIVLATI